MVFVLIQHLDPHHPSALVEILTKATSMSVEEARDGAAVCANHVVILPPNVDMTIQHGVLHLTPRTTARTPHLPIDLFLRSLAEDQTTRAIGVILSGTGTDGTLGLKAVKGEGGIAFAQDQTAQHDGMPRSAVASGCVDFVLPPDKIAAELAHIARHPYSNHAEEPDSSTVAKMHEDEFGKVVRLLTITFGVDLANYKRPTLRRRIERRMVLCRQPNIEEYLRYLRENPAELQALFEDVFIQVTSFFRDSEAFESLKQIVFPSLLAGRPADAPIRVWVPGCASGEEVYSLAISLLEFLGERNDAPPIKLFATDISEKAIAAARSGTYGEGISADVSPERLRRFFEKVDRGYRISKSVRDMCVFAQHDVTKDPPFSQLDLISCRNVLIYLGPALQNRVLPIFHYALKPHGYLLLGTTETVGKVTDLFEVVAKQHRIYARSATPSHLQFDFTPGGRTQVSGVISTGLRDPARATNDVQREVDRVVLSKYSPAGVVIDEQLRIVQFRGHTEIYLVPPPGVPTTDLLQMAREDLVPDLHAAISTAKTDDRTVRTEGVQFRSNLQLHEVCLEVIPIKSPASSERFFIVLFENAKHEAGVVSQSKSETPATLPTEDRQIERLRQELRAKDAYLRSIIEEHDSSNEELKAANEEIVSSNEELQTTNEELETAKEELQATNEELTTVNDELRKRIRVATQLSDDLANLIDSVNIPMVVVGNDLHVRRFSPSARLVSSLTAGDIGRRIGDFKSKINVSDLEPLIREVLDTLVVQEREVTDDEGRWYRMVIRPYRTSDSKIDGATITFFDVDTIKRRELEIEAARAYAVSIVETVRQPLVILDGELRVRTANRAFYQAFQLSPPEVERQLIYLLGGGRFDSLRLRNLLEDVLPKSMHSEDYAIRYEFPEKGAQTLLVNARQLYHLQGQPQQLILLAFEDVTQQKMGEAALLDTQVRTHTLFHTAADGIITINQKGIVDSFNPAAEALFGYAANEVIGRNVSMLMPEPFCSEHDGHIARYLQTGQSRIIGINRETVGRRKDGSIFPIELTVAEIPHLRQFTGFVRDVSRRKQLEGEVLEIASLEQRRIGQELHDGIGQELTGLRYLVDALADMIPEKRSSEAELVARIGNTIKTTLEHVREMSRGLIPFSVNADRLLTAFDNLTSRSSELFGIKCTFDCNTPVLVRTDIIAAQLYRIAQEAIVNAVTHGHAKHVTIGLRAVAGTIQLQIVDDGKGIDNPNYQEEGSGVRIMHYRAGLIGAALQVTPANPHGIQVLCTVGKGANDGQ